MSTINNTQFDINRLPTERNKVPEQKGTVPVYSSRATQAVEHNPKNNERRRLRDRRHRSIKVKNDRRRLIQRRSSRDDSKEQADITISRRGKFINLEV
jgi:hypothetical protein